MRIVDGNLKLQKMYIKHYGHQNYSYIICAINLLYNMSSVTKIGLKG